MDSPDWNAMLQGLLRNTNLTAIIADNLNFNTIAQELVSETNLIAIINTEIKRDQDAENLSKCKRYAVFMSDLSRAAGEGVYWLMMVLILSCMIVSSLANSSTIQHQK
jgi:hypothetical protein